VPEAPVPSLQVQDSTQHLSPKHVSEQSTRPPHASPGAQTASLPEEPPEPDDEDEPDDDDPYPEPDEEPEEEPPPEPDDPPDDAPDDDVPTLASAATRSPASGSGEGSEVPTST
jgi:hypothetical protein